MSGDDFILADSESVFGFVGLCEGVRCPPAAVSRELEGPLVFSQHEHGEQAFQPDVGEVGFVPESEPLYPAGKSGREHRRLAAAKIPFIFPLQILQRV